MKILSIFERLKPEAWRVGLGLGVVLLFIMHSANLVKLLMVENLEGALYDMRVRFTMLDTIDPKVVIIDIDENSLKEEGRWPWSRERIGDLVKNLTGHYKAAVVGMDVVFAEAESQSGEKLMQRLARSSYAQNQEMKAMLAKLQPLLDGDREFARELKKSNVVMGYYFKRANEFQEAGVAGKLPAHACDLAQASEQGMQLQHATGYGANLAGLQDAAAGGGHFVHNLDADGIIRSLPMLMEYKGNCYESLFLAVLRYLINAPQVVVQKGGDPWSSHVLKVGDFGIPVSPDSSALIPYRGYQGSFPYISAVDVLEKRVAPEKLEGVVALLGTTAAGLLDQRTTPVGYPYAGVEVHANIVSGILENRVNKSPSSIPAMETWLLLVLGSVAALLLGRASPKQVMGLVLGAVLLLTVANFVLWVGSAVVLPLASPLLMVAALFVLNMSYGFIIEERTKRQYKESFGQYVSPEVIKEMMVNPQMMESMEGTSRNMTVLFSDIRNFTTISEGMQPKQLMRMMNEYLTPMTRLIIAEDKYKGTIDKYIGDAIMAFWGAPLFDPNHAKHGVLAALEMQRLAAELTEKFKEEGWPEIRIGVGLNTGMMAVGNMGSSFRRAYTVLGDPVNLAARLEGLTKEYGVGILLSENTKAAAPNVVYRELDRVRVKGKGLAVSVFEPVGVRAEVSQQQLDSIEQFHKVLQYYRTQQWDEAEAILKTMPPKDHVLVDLYMRRIAEYRAHPPAKDWDGVTAFTTK